MPVRVAVVAMIRNMVGTRALDGDGHRRICVSLGGAVPGEDVQAGGGSCVDGLAAWGKGSSSAARASRSVPVPAAWHAEPRCRDRAFLSEAKKADGSASSLELRNMSPHRLENRSDGGGGRTAWLAVDGAGRPEPRADGIQFRVDGK